MKILVINAGSSSVKYQLFTMPEAIPLCTGRAERIGEKDGGGFMEHKINPSTPNERKTKIKQDFPDHFSALQKITELLISDDWGVIQNLDEIAGVGHRIVQGGEIFKESVIVTDEVCKDIESLIPLAPLHNPAHLQGIQIARKIFPKAPSIVVFDTEFHQTLPPVAYTYPIPYKYYENFALRRYGFHGTSHRYVANEAAKMMNQPLQDLMLISCHLGNGASVAAISRGKCIDTSMGLTPMAGLVMGSRSGDLDPSIHNFLLSNTDMTCEELDYMYNRESGIFGICGKNDLRDVHNARRNGDKLAQLAFEVFCYSVKKFIGSYIAALGLADAIIFTAGIGENDPSCRKQICSGLENMGILLDNQRNHAAIGTPQRISKFESPIKILVVPTNEEKEIATTTWKLLTANNESSQ